MDIPFQRVPLDSGPPPPKPGGTHAMGTDRNMRYSAGVADKRVHPSHHRKRVDQELLETIDYEGTDVLGDVHLRTSAAAPGSRSSPPSSRYHVDDHEPGSEPTNTPASSFSYRRKPPSPMNSRGYPMGPNDRRRTQNEDAFDETRPSKDTSGRHGRQLRTTEDAVRARTSQSRGQAVPLTSPRQGTPSNKPPQHTPRPLPADESTSKTMPQSETRPLSHYQLIAEVKRLYAELAMVEANCIEIDTGTNGKLNDEQWQALTTLHRALLHEHHVFSLVNPRPAPRLASRPIASENFGSALAIPSFFHHLLLHQLLALTLPFLYLSSGLKILLLETKSTFVGTYLEILDRLSFFMMTIGEDIRGPGDWKHVNALRHQGSNASPKALTAGHLRRRDCRRLETLVKPHALRQFCRVVNVFSIRPPILDACGSNMDTFDPMLSQKPDRRYEHVPAYRLGLGFNDKTPWWIPSDRLSDIRANSLWQHALPSALYEDGLNIEFFDYRVLDNLGSNRPISILPFLPKTHRLMISLLRIGFSLHQDDQPSWPIRATSKLLNLLHWILITWIHVEKEAKQHDAVFGGWINSSGYEYEPWPWVTATTRAYHLAHSYFVRIATTWQLFEGSATARARSFCHKMTSSRSYLPIDPPYKPSFLGLTAYRVK